MINSDKSVDFSSILVPLTSQSSDYYRNCLSFFCTVYGAHDSLPNDLSFRENYDLLLGLSGVKPRPWAASFWVSSVGRPINRLVSVWRKSRLKIIENKKND